MISLILPSRGRPTELFECIYAINDMADNPELVEIIVIIDSDDATMTEWYGPQNCKIVRCQPKIGMGMLNNAGAQASSGHYLVAMNDDCIVRTKSWDTHFRRTVARYKDEICLFWPNDTIFKERLSCFFGMPRKVYQLLGEFGPKELMKYAIDPYVYTVFLELRANGYDRLCYLDDVVFEHLNKHEVAPGVFDYAGGDRALQDQDDAIFGTLWPRLRSQVRALKHAIEVAS